MMGKRKFAPKLYYQVSLDRLVPRDHLLRHLLRQARSLTVRCHPAIGRFGRMGIVGRLTRSW